MEPTRSPLPDLHSPADEVLQSLGAALSPTTGDDFFRSMVEYLTSAWGVDYAVVGRLADGAPQRIETAAFAHQGDGRKFVTEVHGSQTTVSGLPVEATLGLLARRGAEAGIDR